MKLKLLFVTLIISAAGWIALQSASGGAGAVQNADRTGAPGSSQPCSMCHSGGSFNTSLSYTIRDTATLKPVTTVNGGQTYAVVWKVNASGSPSGYGFQGTVRTTSNANAGTWSSPAPNTQISTVSGRSLVEHKLTSPADTFALLWTAPTTVDTVMFYGSGNAVNGNFSTTGDTYGPLATSNMVLVSQPVGIAEKENTFNVYPNPANQTVFINSTAPIQRARLIDLNGRVVSDEIIAGNGTLSNLDISGLDNGVYVMMLEGTDITHTERIVISR